MPNIPKGLRSTYAVKSRAKVIEDKDRQFKGIDKSNSKFYKSRRWQRLRKVILARDSICQHCKDKGRYISANVVDHITPINKGGTNNPNNLQGLCSSCHNKKSSSDRL